MSEKTSSARSAGRRGRRPPKFRHAGARPAGFLSLPRRVHPQSCEAGDAIVQTLLVVHPAP